MTRLAKLKSLTSATLLACSVLSSAVYAAEVRVSSLDDSGTGTLRDALTMANSDSTITEIHLDVSGTINIASTLTYSGTQPLAIYGMTGSSATVDGSSLSNSNLFVSTSPAPLVMKDINFANSSSHGVVVQVPVSATEDISVTLDTVSISNVSLYGLHIDDNSNAEDDAGTGASAGIVLFLRDSSFTNNGTGALDFDGIRVDERGAGSIYADITNTTINGNGGDGIELDEGGAGDVYAALKDTTINGNGFFNTEDLDDGIDIDEADDGDIFVTMIDVTANDNMDEGIDLDEAGNGSAVLTFTRVKASGNADESIKLDEEDAGDIVSNFHDVEVNNSGDDGIQLEEFGAGRAYTNFTNTISSANKKYGIKVRQFAEEDVEETVQGWGSGRGTTTLENNESGSYKLTGAILR